MIAITVAGESALQDGPPVKAVFFDFDGVLTTDRTGSITTTRYISQATGIALSAVKSAFARHNADLTLGRRTHAQVWPQVCADLGRSMGIDVLNDAFASTPLNEPMFKLARALRRVHKVGIITDNKIDRIDWLRRQHNLDDMFDPLVVSAEVGSGKGGQEIFLAALRSAGVKASETVFIDNNKDNLVVPGALGMKTYFHDDETNDVEALVRKLQEFGACTGDA